MKRILTSLLTAMLLTAALCVGASASDFDAVAEDLSAIGMFRGTAAGFELDRAPTRSEAAIMLVRLYGAEESAKAAYAAGADLVGSTMNGYTAATAHCKGDPNYELVQQMAAELPCPVIAEGRVHTPEQAKKMLQLGAWAVVVGGAITRPLEIATRFMNAVKDVNA